MRLKARFLAVSIISFLALPVAAQQAADHVAAIKKSLADSQATLKNYEWIETTVVSLKGEEKSRKQFQCYYGAEGTVQKVPIGETAPAKNPPGLRGMIAKEKKEDISDSMKDAVALVKQYVPPDPQRIDAAKAAGRLSIVPPDSSGKVQVVIKDYLKAGDSLTLGANAATDRIGGVSVATYTDKAKEAVDLKVTFEAFPDGTVYPAQISLDVKKENMNVTVQNSGYKKRGT